MKTKTSKQPKKSKPNVQLKDIKPRNDAKGGCQNNLKQIGIAIHNYASSY